MIEAKQPEQSEPPEPVYYPAKSKRPGPGSWDQDIAELEDYFSGITLPTRLVKLNGWSAITYCPLFVEAHFAIVKANNGRQVYLPYLDTKTGLADLNANTPPSAEKGME